MSVVRLIVATRSNILISGKIIKEMPGSVASGTLYNFTVFGKLCNGDGDNDYHDNDLRIPKHVVMLK